MDGRNAQILGDLIFRLAAAGSGLVSGFDLSVIVVDVPSGFTDLAAFADAIVDAFAFDRKFRFLWRNQLE